MSIKVNDGSSASMVDTAVHNPPIAEGNHRFFAGQTGATEHPQRLWFQGFLFETRWDTTSYPQKLLAVDAILVRSGH